MRETGYGGRERPAADEAGGRYVLCLYVTGLTPHSTRAVANLKAICEQHLAGRYDLDVIDLYQQPALARGEQILAAPTLVKKRPHPPRRLVGDLSQPDRVLAGLGVRPAAGESPP
jgi:circadian clock protein KaiB